MVNRIKFPPTPRQSPATIFPALSFSLCVNPPSFKLQGDFV